MDCPGLGPCTEFHILGDVCTLKLATVEFLGRYTISDYTYHSLSTVEYGTEKDFILHLYYPEVL